MEFKAQRKLVLDEEIPAFSGCELNLPLLSNLYPLLPVTARPCLLLAAMNQVYSKAVI